MIKSYLKKRAEFLIKVILFYFILSLNSYSDNLNVEDRLIVLGSDSAKVKIKVFSSFTCPHCASFHMKILPKIKKEYIDNNKVKKLSNGFSPIKHIKHQDIKDIIKLGAKFTTNFKYC